MGKRGRKCSDCRKKRVRSSSRAKRLLELYGLLSTEYDQLMGAQDNACAICEGTRRQNLSVDHDHNPATPYVRGLLCRLCNGRLLTAARDSPEILRRAADYLENPPAYAVIGKRAVRGAHVRNAASVGPVMPQLEAQCATQEGEAQLPDRASA